MSTRRSRRSVAGVDGAPEDNLNPNTLEGKSLTELRTECTRRALSALGSKNTMVDRLRNWFEDAKLAKLDIKPLVVDKPLVVVDRSAQIEKAVSDAVINVEFSIDFPAPAVANEKTSLKPSASNRAPAIAAISSTSTLLPREPTAPKRQKTSSVEMPVLRAAAPNVSVDPPKLTDMTKRVSRRAHRHSAGENTTPTEAIRPPTPAVTGIEDEEDDDDLTPNMNGPPLTKPSQKERKPPANQQATVKLPPALSSTPSTASIDRPPTLFMQPTELTIECEELDGGIEFEPSPVVHKPKATRKHSDGDTTSGKRIDRPRRSLTLDAMMRERQRGGDGKKRSADNSKSQATSAKKGRVLPSPQSSSKGKPMKSPANGRPSPRIVKPSPPRSVGKMSLLSPRKAMRPAPKSPLIAAPRSFILDELVPELPPDRRPLPLDIITQPSPSLSAPSPHSSQASPLVRILKKQDSSSSNSNSPAERERLASAGSKTVRFAAEVQMRSPPPPPPRPSRDERRASASKREPLMESEPCTKDSMAIAVMEPPVVDVETMCDAGPMEPIDADDDDGDRSEGEVCTDDSSDDMSDESSDSDADGRLMSRAEKKSSGGVSKKVGRSAMLSMMKKASGLLANIVNNAEEEGAESMSDDEDDDSDDDEGPSTSVVTPSFSKEALSAALASIRQSTDDAPLIVQVDPTPEEFEKEQRERDRRRPPLPPNAQPMRKSKRKKANGDDVSDDDDEFIETDLDYQQEIAMAIKDALAANAASDSETESEHEEGQLMGACADVIEALVTAVENGDSHVVVDLTDDYQPPTVKRVSQRTPNGIKLESLEEGTPTLSSAMWDTSTMPQSSSWMNGAEEDDVNSARGSPVPHVLPVEDVILPPLPKDDVQLDFYHSDLHMKSLSFNRHACEPDTAEGLVTTWCGIRATHGITHGRVAYQVRALHKLPTNTLAINIADDSSDRWGLRCGWSLMSVQHAYGYTLGDMEHTWAYGNDAMKGTGSKFKEFGREFMPGDVITCLLDLHQRYMEFHLNGETCGVAFIDLPTVGTVVKREREEDDDNDEPFADPCIYMPHIAAKNCRVEVNYGQLGAWEALPDPYTFVNDYGERHRATTAPDGKDKCTVLMMCGMPGVGKTRWVHEYCSQHNDETWTVISCDSALDHMKLNGLGRHASDALRWDHIMGLAWKVAYRWLELAPRRKRNYIIDGTNIGRHTRRRKMLPFTDFNCKCVFLMPPEETELRRRHRQETMTGMNMPVEALIEMKGLLSVPDADNDPYFEDIFYEELPEADNMESARSLAQKYLARYGYRFGYPGDARMRQQQLQLERTLQTADLPPRQFPDKRVVPHVVASKVDMPTNAHVTRGTLSSSHPARTSINHSPVETGAVFSTQPRKVEHMDVGDGGDRVVVESRVPDEPATTTARRESNGEWHSGGAVADFFGRVLKPSGNTESTSSPVTPSASMPSSSHHSPIELDDDDPPTTQQLWARTKARKSTS